MSTDTLKYKMSGRYAVGWSDPRAPYDVLQLSLKEMPMDPSHLPTP